jgi:hypothetical protein
MGETSTHLYGQQAQSLAPQDFQKKREAVKASHLPILRYSFADNQ